MSYELENYVDVKTRIGLFYERWPDGSLVFEYRGQLDSAPEMIWGIAYAYRNPDDPRPATGTASELAQGKTAFTRGSELMNLETSAVGRAIGNLGIGIEAGLASKQEIQNAKNRQIEPATTTPPPIAELDPWGLPAEPAPIPTDGPSCAHGPMRRKTGLKKNGDPYSGHVCPVGGTGERCAAIWDR